MGNDDFKTVKDKFYYVDKTGWIGPLFRKLDGGLGILFTRPRRFGKSLWLSTLKAFFEKMKKSNLSYFEDLDVFQDKEVMKEQGKYPVIYLSFKDVFGNSVDEVLLQAKQLVSEEYIKLSPQLTKLSSIEKSQVNQIIQKKEDKALFFSSVLLLCRLLYQSTSVKPILLIDEYDAPLQFAFVHDFYEAFAEDFRLLYSKTLKGNAFISFSVLTGVTRIAKVNLFSGLNNIRVNGVLDKEFNSLFGFTYSDTQNVLKDFHAFDQLEKCLSYYGWYRFGNAEIVNPWSLSSFLDSGLSYKMYWQATSSLSLLGDLFEKGMGELYEPLNNLLSGKAVLVNAESSLSCGDVYSSPDGLLSFLLNLGYLSSYQYQDNPPYPVYLPNEETKKAFSDEVISRFSSPEASSAKDNLLLAFKTGNAEYISSSLDCYLLSSFSYYEMKEVMVLSLSALLFDSSYVRSKVNAGRGRCDILVLPKKENQIGLVMEIKCLKSVSSEARMKLTANRALEQILKRNYAKELYAHKSSPIYAYGICFQGQKSCIVSKK